MTRAPRGPVGMEAIVPCEGIPVSGLNLWVVDDFESAAGREVAGYAAATASACDLYLDISSAELKEPWMRMMNVDNTLVAAACFFSEDVKESLRNFRPLENLLSTPPM